MVRRSGSGGVEGQGRAGRAYSPRRVLGDEPLNHLDAEVQLGSAPEGSRNLQRGTQERPSERSGLPGEPRFPGPPRASGLQLPTCRRRRGGGRGRVSRKAERSAAPLYPCTGQRGGIALRSERGGLLSARNLAPMAALCVFEVTPPGLLLHWHRLRLGRELLRLGICGEAGGHVPNRKVRVARNYTARSGPRNRGFGGVSGAGVGS